MQQEPLPFDTGPTMSRAAPARPAVPTTEPEPKALDVEQPRWPFEVQVVRSTRRKRTVGAQMKGDVLFVTVPSWMSRAEEAVWRDRWADRFRRKANADRVDLRERSTTLARRYDLPRPREIHWSDGMKSQWGSCTPSISTIRLSSRLAAFPSWVLDYVIVHELAHLVVLAHNDEFWRIVHQFPKSERAIGYLIARSDDAEDID
ncbi:unannotated protein [freshwater metagenome]|uniref:Unannotated protein n=1 Tax=freshwater metagenome TaxID=449393 RepID=A0A6J7M4J5_9ZZZZ